MALKLNISEKNKTWKLEVETAILEGKSIGEKINGSIINSDLDGYELALTGGTDLAGFPLDKKIEGIGLRKVLRTVGWGMHKLPKKEKKKRATPKGLRLRKTCRGKTIAKTTSQINIKVLKVGAKKLSSIFPDQNKIIKSEIKKNTPTENAPTIKETTSVEKPQK